MIDWKEARLPILVVILIGAFIFAGAIPWGGALKLNADKQKETVVVNGPTVAGITNRKTAYPVVKIHTPSQPVFAPVDAERLPKPALQLESGIFVYEGGHVKTVDNFTYPVYPPRYVIND